MSVPSRSRRGATLVVVLLTLGTLGGCVDAEPTVNQVDATTSVPGLSLTPVDGGTSYYERFANPMSSSLSFFPIGVWLESVTSSEDVRLDRGAGLNTYVGLAANSGTVTTTAASELIVGAGITGGMFSAAGTSFTNRIITSFGDIGEDRIVTTVGTYGATATLTGTAGWVMQVATFKAGTSAP